MTEKSEAYPTADDAIRTRILDLLQEDPAIDAAKIDVRVYEGVVNLVGNTDTEEEKLKTEKIATGVPGVTRVENHLHIDAGIAHALSSLAAHIQGDIIKDTSKD